MYLSSEQEKILFHFRAKHSWTQNRAVLYLRSCTTTNKNNKGYMMSHIWGIQSTEPKSMWSAVIIQHAAQP